MNRQQALTVLAMIQDRNTYFKSLDIASQLTQLKSLNSLISSSSTVLMSAQRVDEVKKLIQKRKLMLQMSLDVLTVLESDSWLVLLEGWNAMVNPEDRIDQ